MHEIHPTAIVDRSVELGVGVRIGAYSIVRGRVTIDDGTVVHEHSHVHGHTVVGPRCQIGPGAYVGLPPQHLKFREQETSLLIGEGTTIREGASVHRATAPGAEHATRVGRRCYLMGGAHVAHDCRLGDEVILANAVLLGGHVVVEDCAFFGGGCAVHQFVRIGRLVIVSGNETVTQDVPPFGAARYGGLKAYNAVGCRRAGLPREAVTAIRGAYRAIHEHRTVPAAVAAIRERVPLVPEVAEILAFIAGSKRGILPSVHARSFAFVGDADA